MRLISPKNAGEKAGLSISTIWRLERAGKFPKRVRISARRVGYIEAEIDAWMQEHAAARDTAA